MIGGAGQKKRGGPEERRDLAGEGEEGWCGEGMQRIERE